MLKFIKLEFLMIIFIFFGSIFSSVIFRKINLKSDLMMANQKKILERIELKKNRLKSFIEIEDKFLKNRFLEGGNLQILKKRYEANEMAYGFFSAVESSYLNLLEFLPIHYKYSDSFIIYPWRFTVVGNYSQLISFLNAILSPNFVYFVIFENIDVKIKENKTKHNSAPYLVMSGTINVYISKKNKLDSQDKNNGNVPNFIATNKIKITPSLSLKNKFNFNRDPFFVIEKSFFMRKKLGLGAWPYDKLKVLGILTLSHQSYCIIEDPYRYIYRVKMHEKVGREMKKIDCRSLASFKTKG